ncbi:antibiotic biosynthesis monooxygenase family protein [Mangrovicoccus algicola]|uniref:Antibiotic biosynthesis monooxygenase n=1 Tax=Mangrovicoccus algicola TaxID=2771008 RepID=A0A8J7CJV1_9RHOB|nr:antibiotic biosynthesis monooxygenase [Mangrovicoccus algicola]MBE3637921.1 antibiotic biosynthesis monooxygenase [Mangrovicoccus algicola]
MYLTMNRFKVKLGQEEAFETVWRTRNSKLAEVPGFVEFHLMKGPEKEDHRLYASHTMWESEAAFRDWTSSEAFRAAHAGARSSGDIYLGPPELELFDSIQSIA